MFCLRNGKQVEQVSIMEHLVLLLCVVASLATTTLTQECSSFEDSKRFDCMPDNPNQQGCESRGCCWQTPTKNSTNGNIGVPYCFYPHDYPYYEMDEPTMTDYGWRADLHRNDSFYYPGTIKQLRLDVYEETENRLHFKIYDPANSRYEVPITTPKMGAKPAQTAYSVKLNQKPFGIEVTRTSDGALLFNSTLNHFLFADQFIQISSWLQSKYVYGLGEHRTSFLLPSDWERFAFWARDQSVTENINEYGDHPFLLNMNPDTGNAHGIFLLNSNAMDVVIQPAPAITYRTIGGILDFYVLLGPEPGSVIQQYTEVIGRPYMPPYWGLGFHLCRWGYGSTAGTRKVVERMRAAGIPQDTQWNDIDYMNNTLDFTLGGTFKDLADLVNDLHANGQHYMMITDPGISNLHPGSYPPYDTGLQNGVFVTSDDGKPLIGKVWPGTTAFPDFFNPKTKQWWTDTVKTFHKTVPFDGMWIDMNEPSNFVSGSITGCPSNSTYNQPPFLPGIAGNSLQDKTICPSARHKIGLHYNLHSLYGYSEMIASHDALISVRQKRPMVISRSTFPGAGQYGGHWLGDNYSSWPNMNYSIAGILSFNLFGIPLVGADICGFHWTTTEEMCQRWMQLGAFYPFSRNHNDIYCPSYPTSCKDQDPAAFSKAMQDSTRSVLLTRYRLLPYLYTLFHKAHANGTTVARPLFFEFPSETALYSVQTQFMWGNALMISPVLTEGATQVDAVIPKGLWYDYYTGANISMASTQTMTLKAPLDTINLHVSAGNMLVMQEPNTTTTASRKNKFGLIVPLASDGTASGELYWDDGDTVGTYENGNYIFITFTAQNKMISSQITQDGYPDSGTMKLGSVIVYGVNSAPTSVTVNGKSVAFKYDSTNKVLNVSSLDVKLNAPFKATWM
ncbi:lysosomal alpha-glucosidase-like isoform X1 [Amphiura filiformis]|uniref:lysosomal alpha-glucosidase-like isoform X1 n=1 Tax=Amphiura filiformis TaxID=82378 RepID=UPI003B228AE1